MILLISIPKYDLHKLEFVKPLERILKRIDRVIVKDYREDFNPLDYDKIVISGTAIKDFEYLNYIKKFSWLKGYNGKLVGICAGAQIIAKVFGCKLKNYEIIGNRYINLTNNKKIKSYFLVTKIPILNEEFDVLGWVDSVPAIFKVRNREIYGLLFHPEVYNHVLLLEILLDAAGGI